MVSQARVYRELVSKLPDFQSPTSLADYDECRRWDAGGDRESWNGSGGKNCHDGSSSPRTRTQRWKPVGGVQSKVGGSVSCGRDVPIILVVLGMSLVGVIGAVAPVSSLPTRLKGSWCSMASRTLATSCRPFLTGDNC